MKESERRKKKRMKASKMRWRFKQNGGVAATALWQKFPSERRPWYQVEKE